MFFSLILATLNRHIEIESCLKSLLNQSEKSFEVIIIDQSEDNCTRLIVEQFSQLQIKYLHVDFKGLSKARNYGLKHAKGEFFCLLDDDAVYSENYLSEAKKMISGYKNVALSGRIFSIDDYVTPFVKYGNIKNGKELNISGIVNYCPSAALVFPMDAVQKIGNFNERLGVGNKYASGEETDFLLRMSDSGYRVVFCANMIVYHPIKPVISLNGVYNHYLGKGALVKLDYCSRKKIRLIRLIFNNTVGMLIKALIIDRYNKKLYMTRLKGFVDGVRMFDSGDK